MQDALSSLTRASRRLARSDKGLIRTTTKNSTDSNNVSAIYKEYKNNRHQDWGKVKAKLSGKEVQKQQPLQMLTKYRTRPWIYQPQQHHQLNMVEVLDQGDHGTHSWSGRSENFMVLGMSMQRDIWVRTHKRMFIALGVATRAYSSGHVYPLKSVPNPRRPPAAFQISEGAAQRILSLMKAKTPEPLGVKVGLKHRGCNGLSYTLKYVNDKSEIDKNCEVVKDKGVTVFIEPRALLNIVGTQMDYVDSDTVSEFVFHNPNAKSTCGCGESFNV